MKYKINKMLGLKNNNFFSEKTGKILAWIGIVSILLGAIIFAILGNWSYSFILDESKFGQFGDFIGGVVGSLLALAGVILYYVALKEQQKEIKVSQDTLSCQTEALNKQSAEFDNQINEMQETRKVYNDQTKEFKRQTDIAKLQQFDSSFYSLLNVFIILREELNKKDIEHNYFCSIYFLINKINVEGMNIRDIYELILQKYFEIFSLNNSDLNHYYKTIYRVYQLIENAQIEDFDKEQYSKILRSQLTDHELLLLYYNSHTILGERARPFIIKYSIFKHLPILDRIEFGDNKGIYESKTKLTSFLNALSKMIKSNLDKYNDFDFDGDINISESYKLLDINLLISLKIILKVELELSFNREQLIENEEIDEKYITKIVSNTIYYILFLSKYKIPNGDEIAIITEESSTEIIIKFQFDNTK